MNRADPVTVSPSSLRLPPHPIFIILSKINLLLLFLFYLLSLYL